MDEGGGFVAVDTRSLLARHLLFRGLAPEILDELVAMSVAKDLKDGDVLFLKGAPGDGLYGVLSGSVRITIPSLTGRELILAVMGPGQLFGEIALLDGGERTASAEALGATRVLLVPHRPFTALLSKRPELCVYFLRIMCDRMRVTNTRLEDAAFLGLGARLAKVLLHLALESGTTGPDGPMIRRRLSQTALGQMVGSSRESVNKQLQAWKRAGWISMERGRIILRRPQSLEGVARTPLGTAGAGSG
jgi:CRP/FNR family transcriptional regulator, cyclic AMP receptor protein